MSQTKRCQTKRASHSNREKWFLFALVIVHGLFVAQIARGEMNPPIPTENPPSTPEAETLSPSDVAALRDSLLSFHFNAVRAKQIADEYASKSLVPHLIQLIESRTQEDISPEELQLRQRAMTVLSQTKSAEGKALFHRIIQMPLKENMSTSEWYLIHAALLTLGIDADDATLDLLFQAATEEYWIKRNPKASTADSTPESFRSHMRIMALNGIARSGSKRAVNALTTWEGLPEDMRKEQPWLLKLAVRKSKELLVEPKAKTENVIVE